jgi:hypothetical protein
VGQGAVRIRASPCQCARTVQLFTVAALTKPMLVDLAISVGSYFGPCFIAMCTGFIGTPQT